MNILKKVLNFYRNSGYLAKFRYTSYYDKLPVSDDVIYVESMHGDGITGSPFYMLREIMNDSRFDRYKIYVSASQKYYNKVCGTLDACGMSRASVVIKNSKEYCRIIATAKYLLIDVSMPLYFIKKEGQIYLNTWHGTPLKALGRSVKDNPIGMGNVQRNFLMTDYLLCPNQYTFEKLRDDHMIASFYNGKYVFSGYPRNAVLFDSDKAAEVREKLNLQGKKIAVYMPTWRENANSDADNQILKALDEGADSDTVIIAKLHHLAAGKIDFTRFNKVMSFPIEYETYEVLSGADCLITDYSSVMFDFAVTGRKIILHAYDCEEYQNTRSMYMDIEQLPFVITRDVKSLVNEVNTPTQYKPYSESMREFTEFDNPNTTKNLIEYVFFGKQAEGMKIIEGSEYHNGKKNVMLYPGSLAQNGLTTAFMGIVNHIDPEQYNYLITFYHKITKPNQMQVRRFDERFNYMAMQGGKNLTYWEAICQYLYFNLNINTGFTRKAVAKTAAREAKRCFFDIHFDKAIHYTGYEKFVVHMLAAMDTEKIIYTHSNLMEERKMQRGVHYNSLVRAYESFDKIVIIRDTMDKEIVEHVPGVDKSKFHLAHNLNNIEHIRNNACKAVEFDDATWCNVSLNRLNEILDDKKSAKYINIARYSEEKSQDRLIKAFAEFNKQHADAYLIIVGSGGNKFEEIRALVEENEFDRVILVNSVSNPYAILNKCDVFVLSSHHEGLPMTIMEALILGKPVICTDITGPREFLVSNECGFLVENSVEGLTDGFHVYLDGRLDSLKKFHAEEFNRIALKEFDELLK